LYWRFLSGLIFPDETGNNSAAFGGIDRSRQARRGVRASFFGTQEFSHDRWCIVDYRTICSYRYGNRLVIDSASSATDILSLCTKQTVFPRRRGRKVVSVISGCEIGPETRLARGRFCELSRASEDEFPADVTTVAYGPPARPNITEINHGASNQLPPRPFFPGESRRSPPCATELWRPRARRSLSLSLSLSAKLLFFELYVYTAVYLPGETLQVPASPRKKTTVSFS